MARLIWMPAAQRDLDTLEAYIASDNPLAAIDVRDRIEDQAAILAQHSHAGRVGRVRGTRELVIAGLPYVLIYRVTVEAVAILRVLHGAQQWPPVAARTTP